MNANYNDTPFVGCPFESIKNHPTTVAGYGITDGAIQESGTWTPVPSVGKAEYTNGRYIKIGDMCYLWFKFNISGIVGDEMSIYEIGGFPFESRGAMYSYLDAIIYLEDPGVPKTVPAETFNGRFSVYNYQTKGQLQFQDLNGYIRNPLVANMKSLISNDNVIIGYGWITASRFN